MFEDGTQLEDLYYVEDGNKAKFDVRKYSLGEIKHFKIYGELTNTDNHLVVFNWLWCKAVYGQKDLHEELISYNAFTDFYNKLHRSEHGTSAEAASIYVALHHIGLLEKSVLDIKLFANYIYGLEI